MLAGREPVLNVSGLKVVFKAQHGRVHAVHDVSFAVAPGEVLALAGAAGAGKSAAMAPVMGRLPASGARFEYAAMTFSGRNVAEMTADAWKGVREREIGVISQDAAEGLGRWSSLGKQLVWPLQRRFGLEQDAAWGRARDLLDLVGVNDPEGCMKAHPRRLPEETRQRVTVAMALAGNPKLLVADDPAGALDAAARAEMVERTAEFRAKNGTGLIWITRDLRAAADFADRFMVMYAGQIVEQGPVSALPRDARHPYTRALIAQDTVTEEAAGRAKAPHRSPVLKAPPRLCAFGERCPDVINRCRVENPSRRYVGEGQDVACWWDTHTGEPYRERRGVKQE